MRLNELLKCKGCSSLFEYVDTFCDFAETYNIILQLCNEIDLLNGVEKNGKKRIKKSH